MSLSFITLSSLKKLHEYFEGFSKCIFSFLSLSSSRSYAFCLQRRFKLQEMGGKYFCQHLHKEDWPLWKWQEDKLEQSNAVQKSRLPCSSAFCHHCQHLHWEHCSSRKRYGAFAGRISTPHSDLCFIVCFLICSNLSNGR